MFTKIEDEYFNDVDKCEEAKEYIRRLDALYPSWEFKVAIKAIEERIDLLKIANILTTPSKIADILATSSETKDELGDDDDN